MRKKNYGSIYTLPLNIWITIFFVIPTSIMFLYSVLKKSTYGGVIWEFSLKAYRELAEPIFLRTAWDTILVSIIVTIGTILLALPTSYYIARSKYKNIMLFLVIIPFWTNFLIRIYAWIAILNSNGLLNSFLIDMNLIDSSIQFLYNKRAIVLVTIYTYLPYAILPLYSTIEKFDFSLLEAARDLGASKKQAIFKVLIPNIKGGITTATLFTFIPSLGSYAIPLLIGAENSFHKTKLEEILIKYLGEENFIIKLFFSDNSFMVGNRIAYEVVITKNWPLASAMSVILTLITTVGVLLFVKMNQNKTETERLSKINEGKN